MKDLTDFSKRKAAQIGFLKKWEHGLGQLYTSCDDAIAEVVKGRMVLAADFLDLAQLHLRQNPKRYRAAVSRGYYSLYHASRAVVFVENAGDDYQDHSVLPKHLPATFPAREDWREKLKDARLLRNQADYEPFEPIDSSFMNDAKKCVDEAKDFYSLAKSYISIKGITL